MNYILAIDQGTTGTTATLVDSTTFEFMGKVNCEYPQIYPRPGWVEHNLNDIWNSTEKSITKLLNQFNVTGNDIQGIGITNQRETTCAFNSSGEPLHNAIVWQDRRTANLCQNLKSQGLEESIRKKTGLPLDPYFSATKMKWLLENVSSIKREAQNNNLYFGTIDTFLLYKLSGNTSFKTEASNASRTLLMDLNTGEWCDELCQIFGVNKAYLPSIEDSFTLFGKTKGLSFLPDSLPIYGILGDQQSALFGQACYQKNSTKCTYGTGAFMLVNTGTDVLYSNNGLLTTVAYQHKNKRYFALEGSCYIAGAAVQWLRDNLSFFEKSSEIESLARQVQRSEEMEHLLFLPFFTGLGSPHWISDAKGAIIGLTRDTNQSHIARACLEGIALSINDLLSAMKKDLGSDIVEMKVDGGAVENTFLMELQATFSNIEIIRPEVIETTSYGAALAAGIGGNFLTFDKIQDLWSEESKIVPTSKLMTYCDSKKKQWESSINRIYVY